MHQGRMNPGMSCEPCPTQACAINHLETMWALVCVCVSMCWEHPPVLGTQQGLCVPLGQLCHCTDPGNPAMAPGGQGALHAGLRAALVGFR